MQTGGSWIEEFHPYSAAHAGAVAVCAVLTAVSCTLGLRWKRTSPERERRLAFAWGGFVVATNAWSIIYWVLPGRFDPRTSFPLQLCDLAGIVAALAFLTPWRWSRTLIYFWGLGLSTQAFVTPTLHEGAGTMRFWLFWGTHLCIVGSALYDLIVRSYRPGWRDLATAVAISIGWLIAVTVVNLALGANYGYVGNTTPDVPTFIDHLGPWPARVFVIAGLGIGAFAVMWAVWPVARTLRGVGRSAAVDSAP